jgi:hypothetical protein
MNLFTLSSPARTLLGVAIGSVWVFHGLYSKILHGIPRHEAIVTRILGAAWGPSATLVIGILEVLLGLWACAGWHRRACATIQTLGIVAMNSLEIARANDLLISAPGMVLLNFLFLLTVWFWALSDHKSIEPHAQVRSFRLRRVARGHTPKRVP